MMLSMSRALDSAPARAMLSVFVSMALVALIGLEAHGLDRIELPSASRDIESSNGSYILRLSTFDQWQSKHVVAELFQKERASHTLLWHQILPHEYGPRYALVGKEGQVLLLDEWINVKSSYAATLVGRDGQVIRRYDFEAILEILGVPVAEVVRSAKYGWWISLPPAFDSSGTVAEVRAAGTILRIRLEDGNLSLSPSGQ